MNTGFFKLSHAQLRIWNIEQLYGQTTINNIIGLSKYNKKIDIDLLRSSIINFVKNSSFGLQFFIEEDDIYQKYSDIASEPPIPVVDFSDEEQPESAFKAYLNNEMLKPFDVLSNDIIK